MSNSFFRYTFPFLSCNRLSFSVKFLTSQPYSYPTLLFTIYYLLLYIQMLILHILIFSSLPENKFYPFQYSISLLFVYLLLCSSFSHFYLFLHIFFFVFYPTLFPFPHAITLSFLIFEISFFFIIRLLFQFCILHFLVLFLYFTTYLFYSNLLFSYNFSFSYRISFSTFYLSVLPYLLSFLLFFQ